MLSFSLKNTDFSRLLISRRARAAARLTKGARAGKAGLKQELLVSAARILGGDEFKRHQTAAGLLASADDALKDGRWAEAEKYLSEALLLVPALTAARYARGLAFLKLGKARQAIVDLEHATKSAGAPPEWFGLLAEAHERLKDFPAAAASLRRALERAPGNPAWHYRLGWICEDLGQTAEAEKSYHDAITHSSDPRVTRLGIGILHEQRGDWERALAAYKAKAEENPSAELCRRLAVACERSLRWVEAERYYRAAVAADSTDARLHYRLGLMLERHGKWLDAASAFRAAIDRSSQPISHWYQKLEYALARVGRLDDGADETTTSVPLAHQHLLPLASSGVHRRSPAGAAYFEYREFAPLEAHTIVYESNRGRSVSGGPRALLEHLLAHPIYGQWQHVVAVERFSAIPPELRKAQHVIFARRDSILYQRHLATAGYLISDEPLPAYFTRRSRQKYLHIWRETPLRAIGRDLKTLDTFLTHLETSRDLVHATHLLTANAHTSQLLTSRFGLAQTLPAMAETGSLRADRLLRVTAQEKAELRAALGLPDGIPVVLYAPVSRGAAASEPEGQRFKRDLKAMAGDGHALLFLAPPAAELLLQPKKLPAKLVPQDIDPVRLLAIVDVLITDYSGIFFDFLPTGRPILHYVSDWTEQKQRWGKFYLKKRELPGVVCRTRGAVTRAVTAALGSRPSLTENYRAGQKKFAKHADGQTVQRAIEFFLEDARQHVVARPETKSKKLLIYAGNFDANGITSSFIHLVRALDSEKHGVTLAIESEQIAASPLRWQKLREILPHVDIIGRSGTMWLRPEEKTAIDRNRRGQNPSAGEQWALHDAAFLREFRRVFGIGKWDAVVNFDGRNRRWISLLGAAKPHAQKTLLYLRDVVSSPLGKPDVRSLRSRDQLERFDGLAFVSKPQLAAGCDVVAPQLGLPTSRFVLSPPVVYPRLVRKYATKALEPEVEALLAEGPVVLNIWSTTSDYAKLLTAFRSFHTATPSARLLIVGNAPTAEKLSVLKDSPEKGSAVRVLPPQANLIPIIKRATCVVMANSGKWPSMTRMEAAAVGTPFVATHEEGVTPRIDAWGTLLVPNTAEALATGLQEVLTRRSSQSTLSPRGYAKKAVRAFVAAACKNIPVRRAVVGNNEASDPPPVSAATKKPALWKTHESLLATAANASKDRHWPLAASLWQMAVDNFQGVDQAYASLCQARRNLSDFANARRASELGLRRFPDSHAIIVERALLEMDAGHWKAALEFWPRAGNLDQLPARHVHAFAFTCEMLGRWDQQRRVITSAVVARQSDPTLKTRLAFGAAMQELATEQYADASRHLKLVATQPQPKHFPFGYEAAAKFAHLQLQIAGQADSAKWIQKVSAAITRPHISGPQVVDLIGLPELLLAHFDRSGVEALREIARMLRAVTDKCGVSPEPIQTLQGDELHAAVCDLPDVVERTDTRPEWLPAGGWLTISTLALIGGRFDLYHRCRNHALENEKRFAEKVSRADSPLSAEDVRRLSRVAAETGDEQLFALLRARHDSLEKRLGAKNCLVVHTAALSFGDRQSCIQWSARKVSSGDRLLRKLVKGKSIAIVGPVDVGLDHGAEIDSFDLIIRFNYRGLGAYNPQRFGSRTDVSYYVRSGISRPNYAAFELAMNELKLICIDSKESRVDHAALFERVKTPLRKRLPAGASFANPFLKGTPNGVQRVLFDLMRFETGRIKVFNSNLWISNDVAPDYKHTQKFTYRDLVRHDAISNFVFMQRAHAHGLIEADAVLSSVLKMSVDDYVAALQTRYGSRPTAA